MKGFRFPNHTSLRLRLIFYSQVTPSGCWEWIGRLDRDGYARMGVGLHIQLAHRVSYEEFTGPIPDELPLDHLCRVRRCINPAHLEPVTPQENSRRAAEARTHCGSGHLFTPENTYRVPRRPSARYCRECMRANSRRYAEKKIAKVTR